jgi:hypothetical protein
MPALRREVEAGGCLVPGQPGLHRPVSKNKTKHNKKKKEKKKKRRRRRRG